MPQLANIVINDGKAVPVAHTFAPVTTDGYAAKLAERTSVPVGNPLLEVSVKPPVSNNALYRVKLAIKVPATVTADGTTKVDYTQMCTVEFTFSERGDEASRKDIRVLAANMLANASVITVLEKLEPIY